MLLIGNTLKNTETKAGKLTIRKMDFKEMHY